jgi:hypothetical protein
MLFSASAPQGQAARGAAPVTVVNTPLPVEASITGTITGDVSVTNTPDVKVMNEPMVTVGNSATNPVLVRDLDNPAQQPYAENVLVGINEDERSGSSHFSSIPAGKRLVIEYVNVDAQYPAGQGMFMTLSVHTNGAQLVYGFPASLQASLASLDEVLGSHPVRIYVDSETEPVFTCFRPGSTSSVALCQMTISGHFIDAS